MTVNFAHARTWPVLIGTLLAMILPMLFLARAGLVNTGIWFGVLAALVLALIVVSWCFADSKRYED